MSKVIFFNESRSNTDEMSHRATKKIMVYLSVIEARARPTISLDDIECVWASRRENSNCDQKYEFSVNIRVEHASRESKPISTNTRITGIKTHIVYLFAFFLSFPRPV